MKRRHVIHLPATPQQRAELLLSNQYCKAWALSRRARIRQAMAQMMEPPKPNSDRPG